MTASAGSPRPTPHLRVIDAVAIIVGVVIGVGIFRAPGLVAAGVDTEAGFIGLWVLGGALSLVGALCYAELVTTFPSAGGEYHFLHRAFGRNVSFLFAWARLTVIGTGSLALLAFVFGDHVTKLVPLGPYGSALAGAVLVIVLVGLNVLGLRVGAAVQRLVTGLLVVGLVAIVIAGLWLAPPAVPVQVSPPTSSLGFAMVFVLLTYGGWNEAAYLSAEVRGGARRIAWALVAGVGAITAIYVLTNVAYVRALGLPGVREAETVGVDLVQTFAGGGAAALVSSLIAIAALTSMNATILTVSRTAYALAGDIRLLRPLSRWDARAAAPIPAMLALGAFALVLIGLGAIARSGFSTMVEFTAPVFWAFFFLTGAALIVLRAKEPHAVRPFRVPLYPIVPLVFCATCLWLLRASLEYARLGAIAGVGVLLLGAVPLWIERGLRRPRPKETADETLHDDSDRDHGRARVGV
jgi:APA family basic amino acid/polyamine antiporter